MTDKSDEGNETFLLAADRGDLPALRRMICGKGSFVDPSNMSAIAVRSSSRLMQRFNLGSTALMLAAKHGHALVLRFLIDEMTAHQGSFSVDAEKDQEGWTALYYAVSAGNTEAVGVLLSCGADAGIRDSYHRRKPIDVAKHRQYYEIVELLRGPNPAPARKSYTRSSEEIVRASKKRGVMRGVHRKHLGAFLGRYRFVYPAVDVAVEQIEDFRSSLDANSVTFVVFDEVQPQLGTDVTLTLSHKPHPQPADGICVIRKSCIGTHEHMVVTIKQAIPE